MKRFHFAAGLFVMACLGVRAPAQSMDMYANIPFDFQFAGKQLPAGEYLLHHSDDVLIVKQESGGHSGALRYTIPIVKQQPPTHGELRFNRYGDVYFLEELWAPGSGEGRALVPSSREREFARRSRQLPGVVAVDLK